MRTEVRYGVYVTNLRNGRHGRVVSMWGDTAYVLYPEDVGCLPGERIGGRLGEYVHRTYLRAFLPPPGVLGKCRALVSYAAHQGLPTRAARWCAAFYLRAMARAR